MLTYNTRRKKLVLPEYGRILQKMVDHCLSLTDVEERNRCAQSIIKTMANMFPNLREKDAENPELTYWNILAIMSGFSGDIDWPEGTVNEGELREKPQPVPMTQGPMMFSVYGKNVQRMMEYAMDMPGGEEKDQVIMLVANQMKKQLTALNPDNVDDARVFKDIAAMTGGAIRMNPEQHHLHEFRVIQPAKKKRKK